MIPGVLEDNLLAWFVQIAVVAAVAIAAPAVLRVRSPRTRLAYWQGALLLCCLLPLVQPWQSTRVLIGAPAAPAASRIAAPADRAPIVDVAGFAPNLAAALMAGAGLRVLWILLGFLRLGRLRRLTKRLDDPAVELARSSTGVTAPVLLSTLVRGPITFGLVRPVVLVPPPFCELPDVMRHAILCHEFLHVRRRDSVAALFEECAASMLWFHPAVWWLTGRIRLAREQSVDEAVVALTGNREEYVRSMIAIANGGTTYDFSPASPFLRKRHLLARVTSLARESNMSTPKHMLSVAASGLLLLLGIWAAARTFPLQAEPQIEMMRPDINVKADTGSLKLLHRPPLRYPPEARSKRVSGTVVLELTVDATGTVADARVLSGPEELRRAALQSVLEWHYSREGAPARLQVSLTYDAPPELLQPPAPAGASRDSGFSLRTIEYSVPDAVKQDLEPVLRAFIGRPVNVELMQEMWRSISEIEPHASINLRNDTVTVMLRDQPNLPMQMTALSRRPGGPQGIAGSVSGGIPQGTPGGIIGGIVGGVPAAEPKGAPTGIVGGVAAPIKGAISNDPRVPSQIRVGANVQAAKLVSQPEPEYPPLARQARIQGIVRFNVVVGEDGTVQNLTLVSGHPVLVPAATEAMRRYVYQPTYLNGVPVQIHTTVDVPFMLPSQ